MTNKKVEKSAEEVLFPEVKVGDIVVKPWSFGVLFEISSNLERILDKMDARGLSLDVTGDFISYSFMLKLFTVASSELLDIISTTVDESEEKIKELKMEEGIQLAITIARQNWNTIKNAVSPLLNQLIAVEDTNPEESEDQKS